MADDGDGNVGYMESNGAGWSVDEDSYNATAPSATDSLWSFYDTTTITQAVGLSAPGSHWSFKSRFTIGDATTGFLQNARMIFNFDYAAYTGVQTLGTAEYVYLEADAATKTWSLGSTYGEFVSEYSIVDPSIEVNEEYSVELRKIDVAGVTDRIDLFVNESHVVSWDVLDDEINPNGQLSQSLRFGVGAGGSAATFDDLTVATLEVAPGPIVVTPSEDMRLIIENGFGTVDGYSFVPDILGVDEQGFAYQTDGIGGVVRLTNPRYVHVYNAQEEDYIVSTLASGGSVWDLSNLREIDPETPAPQHVLDSFSTGFSEALSREILAQILSESIRSDSALVTGVQRVLDDNSTALTQSFAVTLRGDGRSHAFDLQFVPDHYDPQTGAPLGTIPVAVTGAYAHDFEVNDYENDAPFTLQWDPEFIDSAGQVITHGATLVSSGRPGYVHDRLIWDPPAVEVPTDFQFRVIARDAQGGAGRKDWTVTVAPTIVANQAPSVETAGLEVDPIDGDAFDGLPLLPNAHELRSYRYQVDATDADPGDQQRLRYYLVPTPVDGAADVPPPAWLNIDRNTGVLNGRPGNYDLGTSLVSILVSDGRLIQDSATGQVTGTGETLQSFAITVEPRTFINIPPSVGEIPDLVIRAEQTFQWAVQASDINQDQIEFAIAGPAGMAIHPTEGMISWTPATNQVGQVYSVTVSVSDGQATVSRSFSIDVEPTNRDPVIETTILPDAAIFLPYLQTLRATDADGDAVNFTLVSGPAGMIIANVNGETLLAWDKVDFVVGPQRVVVRADDGMGGTDEQEFRFDVLENPIPQLTVEQPTIWLTSVPDQAVLTISTEFPILNLQDDVAINGDAIDWGMVLTPPASGTTVDDHFEYEYLLEWTPSFPGEFPILLEVNDSEFRAVFRIDIVAYTYVPPEENQVPEFRTTTLPSLMKNRRLLFPLEIVDPDGHIRSVHVVPEKTTAPDFDDANLDPSRGRIDWTPGTAGNFQITLQAIDDRGAVSEHTYHVVVGENSPPNVDFDPVFPATLGQDFEFPFTLSDPNPGDTVTARLNAEALANGLQLIPPDPAAANPNEWKLVWYAQDMTTAGIEVPIAIPYADNHGLGNTLRFDLPIYDPNGTASQPVATREIELPAGRTLFFTVGIDNPGNTPLTFGLTMSNGDPLPPGISISPDGVVNWTPSLSLLAGAGGQLVADKIYDFDVTIHVGNPVANTFILNLQIKVINPADVVVTPPGIDAENAPPPTSVTAGIAMVYQPRALPVGDDVPRWRLDAGPEGMQIDPSTGRISWIPGESLIGSRVDVELSVFNSLGAASQLKFWVDVVATNQVPSIIGTFPGIWTAGDPFAFNVQAEDPEGHALVYEILHATGGPVVEEPGGISIDEETGLIEWADPVAGTYFYLVGVKEKHQPSFSPDPRPFTLRVVDVATEGPINHMPIVANSPNGKFASVGAPFRFQFDVSDLDQGAAPFGYSLASPNFGATVNSGLFEWTPTESGQKTFRLLVTDTAPAGTTPNETFVTFTIDAVANEVPQILSSDTLQVVKGQKVVHRVRATDPDGGPLSYAIDPNSAPDGMTIDRNTGMVHWNVPADESATSYDVIISVTDEYGAATVQTLNVSVHLHDTIAPTISFHIKDNSTGGTLLPGQKLDAERYQDYVMWVDIRDNLGVSLPGGGPNAQWTLVAENSGSDIVTTGLQAGGLWAINFVTGSGPNQGILIITIEANDANGNNATQTWRYYVEDKTVLHNAKLLNVTDDLTIDKRFEIVGNAYHSDAGGIYDLKLTSLNDPNDFVYLVEGAPANITGGVIGAIDPTLIRSGMYRLYLEVRCPCETGYKIVAIDERIVEVRNAGGLGTLDLSFTDLQVDLGGIPISLVRSYSSSLVGKNGTAFASTDFGPGWTLDLLQAAVDVAHPQHVTTALNQPFARNTRVIVELPDGSLQRFSFAPEDSSGQQNGAGPFYPYFRPDADVYNTLEIIGQESLLLLPAERRNDGTFVTANGDEDYIPYRFGGELVLRTPSGLSYVYNLQTGRLSAIEDDSGRPGYDHT